MFKFINISNILLALLFSSVVYADDIVIENAWIREAPPISRVQAGYVTINNTQNHTVTIVAANSPSFRKIEFHKTVLENGLSKMLQQSSITISSKSQISLKPESMHMMLFNPIKPLRAGEKINITFTLKNKSLITTSFLVRKVFNTNSPQHKHH